MTIDQYYLLLEAYDRLGLRLDSRSWTGSEVFEAHGAGQPVDTMDKADALPLNACV